jgi:hypothetical protein
MDASFSTRISNTIRAAIYNTVIFLMMNMISAYLTTAGHGRTSQETSSPTKCEGSVSTRSRLTCVRQVCFSDDIGNPVWLISTRNQIATVPMPQFNNVCSSTIVDTNSPLQMT